MSRIQTATLLTLLWSWNAFAADAAWVALPSLPDPRQEIGVAELQGKIYVVGGLPSTTRVQEYDPATGTWRFRAPLPASVDHPAAASAGGRLYILGGYVNGADVATVYSYDPAADQWTSKAPMPTARGAPAAAVIGGKIYVVGGSSATQRDLEAFDPEMNSWSRLAPMPTGRNHLAAGAIQGKLYVAGGRPGNLGALEIYDPATNFWTSGAPLPTPRSGLAGAVLNDRFYTFGGEGNPASPIGIFKEAEVYDPRANSWRSLDPMPTPRHGVGAAVLGNRIYVPAGATQAGGGTQTGANEALVLQSEKLYFAHFAAGQGIATDTIVGNLSETQTSLVTIELFGREGSPLEADLAGSLRSRATVTVAPLAATTLPSRDTSATLAVGSVLVSSELPATGSVLFTSRIPGFRGVAGVGASAALTRFFVPVERDTAAVVSAGIAVANTTTRAATVMLSLRDETGSTVATRQIELAPLGQSALFLEQIFTTAPATFRGSVTGTSTAPVAALALRFSGDEFATLPVTPY
jgi:N-acetylneuraminic acid mutarotase